MLLGLGLLRFHREQNAVELKNLFGILLLTPPHPGGPGGGSGLQFCNGDRGFGADSGPDPGPIIRLALAGGIDCRIALGVGPMLVLVPAPILRLPAWRLALPHGTKL